MHRFHSPEVSWILVCRQWSSQFQSHWTWSRSRWRPTTPWSLSRASACYPSLHCSSSWIAFRVNSLLPALCFQWRRPWIQYSGPKDQLCSTVVRTPRRSRQSSSLRKMVWFLHTEHISGSIIPSVSPRPAPVSRIGTWICIRPTHFSSTAQ